MPFPVDPRFIDESERKLATTFPSTFRGKMIRHNGGTVECAGDAWELYPFLDSSDRKRLSRTCNDIVRETNMLRQWPTFPAAAVAIAGNGTADQLVFLPRPDRPNELGPAVFLWDHETGDLEKVGDDPDELVTSGRG